MHVKKSAKEMLHSLYPGLNIDCLPAWSLFVILREVVGILSVQLKKIYIYLYLSTYLYVYEWSSVYKETG